MALATAYCQNATLSDCPGAKEGWVALRSGGALTKSWEDCYPVPGKEKGCWRCYSPDTLNADHTAYIHGTDYCTREDELLTLMSKCKQISPFPGQFPFSNGTEVFVPGESGYPAIRIPTAVLSGRIINAFAECRNFTGDGCNPNVFPPGVVLVDSSDICQKQSHDGGRTWGRLRVIARGGKQAAPVYIPDTSPKAGRGRLLLHYVTPCAGTTSVPNAGGAAGHGQSELRPTTHGRGLNISARVTRVGSEVCADTMQMSSTDYGTTWSKPLSVCSGGGGAGLPKGECGGYIGPAFGIQLKQGPHKGRILFISQLGGYSNDTVVFSDDDGKTYHASASSTHSMQHTDEAQIVELPNGDVLANLRTNHLNATCDCRATSRSTDGGNTWGPINFDAVLTSPVCAASIIRVGDQVLFANPSSTAERVHGVLRRSRDGVHWSSSKVVWPGAYGYSCLVQVPSDVVVETAGQQTPNEQTSGQGSGRAQRHVASTSASTDTVGLLWETDGVYGPFMSLYAPMQNTLFVCHTFFHR